MIRDSWSVFDDAIAYADRAMRDLLLVQSLACVTGPPRGSGVRMHSFEHSGVTFDFNPDASYDTLLGLTRLPRG